MALVLAALLAAASCSALAQPLTDLERECGSQDDGRLFDCWLAKYEGALAGTPAGSVAAESSRQRFGVFRQNLALIREHNANPEASWRMEANEFAALTWEEFASERLSAPQDCSATHGGGRGAAPAAAPAAAAPPAAMDWRERGVVTPVKDQGSCGSCWTFSTTGAVESHFAIASKRLVALSEQQLVDCAGAFNNHGCGGGLPSQAMEYIRFWGGLEQEADYPYLGRNSKCKFDPAKATAHVSYVNNITQGDEDQIFQAVGTVGPVSIAYDCTLGFQFYHSGVYDGWFCSTKPSGVNHAVLAVGYGHDEKSGKDYWLVKNSWGSRFGEEGYFRIVRNKNKCGLADCASYPKVEAPSAALVV